MKHKKLIVRWALVILAMLLPLFLSLAFILLGQTDENGRVSMTGETTSTPEGFQKLICESQRKIAESAAELLGIDVPQDASSGCEPIAQMGASPYYKVDVSSPSAFYGAVNGVGFNEGYGYQCVAGFKEFMYSLSGRYVATSTGGASGYARQQAQIEPLGFTWYSGTNGIQDGDWAIFGGGTYGHVAMWYRGQWFGQNQGAANSNQGNAFNLRAFGMENVIGYYRPNIYVFGQQPDNPTPEEPAISGHQSDNYIVARGDTLGGISLDMGWWPSADGLYGDGGYAQRLAEHNGIKNRGLVYPGQLINRY